MIELPLLNALATTIFVFALGMWVGALIVSGRARSVAPRWPESCHPKKRSRNYHSRVREGRKLLVAANIPDLDGPVPARGGNVLAIW
jgi:hypothetical protein